MADLNECMREWLAKTCEEDVEPDRKAAYSVHLQLPLYIKGETYQYDSFELHTFSYLLCEVDAAIIVRSWPTVDCSHFLKRLLFRILCSRIRPLSVFSS